MRSFILRATRGVVDLVALSPRVQITTGPSSERVHRVRASLGVRLSRQSHILALHSRVGLLFAVNACAAPRFHGKPLRLKTLPCGSRVSG